MQISSSLTEILKFWSRFWIVVHMPSRFKCSIAMQSFRSGIWCVSDGFCDLIVLRKSWRRWEKRSERKIKSWLRSLQWRLTIWRKSAKNTSSKKLNLLRRSGRFSRVWFDVTGKSYNVVTNWPGWGKINLKRFVWLFLMPELDIINFKICSKNIKFFQNLPKKHKIQSNLEIVWKGWIWWRRRRKGRRRWACWTPSKRKLKFDTYHIIF